MRKFLITIAILSTFCYQGIAQSEAMYSQYMFNGLAINPAYAGSHQSLSITALSRMQSIGVDGAPNTQTFSAHNAINNQKIGLGILVLNDKIGVIKQTGGYISYAYKIKFDDATLSFGLQGGGTVVDANYSELLIDNPGDPNFEGDLKEFKPSFGTGIYLSTSKFYAGISLPQMLETGDKRISQLKPFIVTGGMMFSLSPTLLLKPNILFRMVDKRAVEFNFNTNLLIHEILWVGVSYRPNNTLNGILEIQINDKLRVGYAYDAGINEYRRANSGAHEFMLNYELRYAKQGVHNPRSY